jgi:hypothetical protein
MAKVVRCKRRRTNRIQIVSSKKIDSEVSDMRFEAVVQMQLARNSTSYTVWKAIEEPIRELLRMKE